MLRILAILFICSLIGINSVLTHFLGDEGAGTAVKSFVRAKPAPGNGSFTSKLTAYAAEAVGLTPNAIPVEGCQPVANKANLRVMLDSLPEAQRAYLTNALASAPSMPVELYNGPLGHGFCMPSMGMMVNLPANLIPTSLPPGLLTPAPQ